MSRFQRGCKSIYNIGYHVIWCPKYRKSILKGKFKSIIKDALFEKANHLFIKCSPKDKICDIVKSLKGYSSYKVRKAYPKYKIIYKSLWSPSYYSESVGHISEMTIKKYIEDQLLMSRKHRKKK